MSARPSRKATLPCLREAVLRLRNAVFQYYKHNGNAASSPRQPAQTTGTPSVGLTAPSHTDFPYLVSPVQKGLTVITSDVCSFLR